MANLVISAAGAVVGYMVGGPKGAQIGWMVGSMVAASREEIDQRTIGGMALQSSEYGQQINQATGKNRMAGQIIWAGPKKHYDIKRRQGKGGPSVVTTGTKVDVAIALCGGPIDGVSKVWANEKLLVDSSVESKPMPGEVYLGDMTQTPDPTMEAVEGSGNVPAYRGLAYIVLKDFDVTNYGGVLPQFSFEVCRGASL